jgi:hypothetical protein
MGRVLCAFGRQVREIGCVRVFASAVGFCNLVDDFEVFQRGWFVVF